MCFVKNDWINEVSRGLTTICGQTPRGSAQDSRSGLERWLESQGRTPAEMSLKGRLRKLLGYEVARTASGTTRQMTGRKGRAERSGRFIEPMMCLALADMPAGSQWPERGSIQFPKPCRVVFAGLLLLPRLQGCAAAFSATRSGAPRGICLAKLNKSGHSRCSVAG